MSVTDHCPDESLYDPVCFRIKNIVMKKSMALL